MNQEQIAKLKELAQAATPGPWRHDGIEYGDMGHRYQTVTAQNDGNYVVGEYGIQEHDAAFISAANPAAILELIALAEHSLSAQDEVLTDDRKSCCGHDSDCAIHNAGCPELLGPCNCSLSAAAPSPAVAVAPVARLTTRDQPKDLFDIVILDRARCHDGMELYAATPSPSLAVREKPNADCSGEPANCPDNEGYGCACDPMNEAAMREKQT